MFLAGKNAKEAAVERAKMAGSSLLRQAAGRKRKAPGAGTKEMTQANERHIQLGWLP